MIQTYYNTIVYFFLSKCNIYNLCVAPTNHQSNFKMVQLINKIFDLILFKNISTISFM